WWGGRRGGRERGRGRARRRRRRGGGARGTRARARREPARAGAGGRKRRPQQARFAQDSEDDHGGPRAAPRFVLPRGGYLRCLRKKSVVRFQASSASALSYAAWFVSLKKAWSRPG